MKKESKIYVFKIILIIVVSLLLGAILGVSYQDIEMKNQTEQIELLIRHNEVHYMYGTATAYTPSAGGINSDSNPKVTSTMKPAKEGVIAVNPEVIPYGSEVMIISGKIVIRGKAQDTGGAMRKNPNQVDILMEDRGRALEWGRKSVHIIWW
jgi:3D (Asp-Asp-Asp) domain-containing protein